MDGRYLVEINDWYMLQGVRLVVWFEVVKFFGREFIYGNYGILVLNE